MLLDLIYRLSLDDKASDGDARAPRDGTAKERHRKERPAGDDEDDEARRLRARAKEARREEREREKKEKVLHKALKEDRRAERRDKASGGVGPDDDDDDSNRHPHLLDRPKPAGEKIAVTATCASGETKLLQIARADDLESLFKAARSKFKAMKKAPNTARLHAPPGPAIEDSRSLAPGAVVFVDFDETKDAAKKNKNARRKPRAASSQPEDDVSAEIVAEISAGNTPRVDEKKNDTATDADTTEDVAPRSLPGASGASSPERQKKKKPGRKSRERKSRRRRERAVTGGGD